MKILIFLFSSALYAGASLSWIDGKLQAGIYCADPGMIDFIRSKGQIQGAEVASSGLIDVIMANKDMKGNPTRIKLQPGSSCAIYVNAPES